MRFIPSIAPSPGETGKPPLWFLISGDRLFVGERDGSVRLPESEELSGVGGYIHLGSLDGRSCRAVAATGITVPADLRSVGLRRLYGRLPDEVHGAAGYGLQMLRWERDHRFCGGCGHPTENKPDERAKICPRCKGVAYPRISPAVIVAVVKGDKLLLARSGRFPSSTLHSVIAGYVEAGEDLEACVAREVREEVGLEVRNIRYFGSQPWPYSSSLMVGFTAEHAGGAITVDLEEILEAGWFSADALPEIPAWGSIARALIDWFAAGRSPGYPL